MAEDTQARRREAEGRAHAAEQRILVALAENRPLPDVLQVVVTGLEQQIEGARCAVVVERGDRLKVLAPGSLPASLLDAIETIDPATVNFGAEPVIVDDFEPLPAVGYRNVAIAAGVRSLVALPIHEDRRRTDVLAVHRTVAGPMPAHELALASRAAGIVGVLLERAETETNLRESERRLRQIAESLREGIWISTIENQALYVSPSCADIIGIPLDEMYTNGLGFLRLVHPDDRPMLEKWAAHPADLNVEFRLHHPDGRMRWLRTQIMPIRDGNGVVYRYAGVVEDITPWKDALERVRESESHYRRLVNTAPIGIYAVDAEGAFTELNPAGEAILDRASRDVIGRNFVDFLALQDVEPAMEVFQRLIGGETSVETMELSIVRPSGEQRLIALTVTAMRDGDTVTGLQGIGSDITEERQRDIQLRRAERLASVGTLIGGVAHELNNPLTAIRGLAELMLGDARTDDDRDVLGMIRRESDRMAKIVSDLRLLARQTQESGKDYGPVDLNEVVQHVLRVRRYTLQTSNVEVIEELDPAIPPVHGHMAELEQVLLNLVVNAEQALIGSDVRNKQVIVRTRRAGGCVALHVVDNGPGIPKESLERIFDPFYTTKDPGAGTGLGLSLVNSIVSEHGGSVRARSRIGAGAEFIVEIPTAKAGENPPAVAEPAEPKATGLRVLVVEDEATIQSLIRRMLERRGHAVTLAGDGAEALRELDATNGRGFDVILSDLRMPGLSGEEFVRRLRQRGRGEDRRVVFMTGDAMSEGSARVIEEAEVPVLMKPFTTEQLVALVERVAPQP